MLESMLLNRTGLFESSYGYGYTHPEIEGINLDTVYECEGNPFEFITQVMYENELNFQNVEKAVMLTEFAYLYEHGTVIDESSDSDSAVGRFFDKVKENIKKVWDGICSFFKKIFATIESWVRNDASFVKKYEKDAKEAGTVNIKDEKIKGYTGVTIGEIGNVAVDMLNKMQKACEDLTRDADKFNKDEVIKSFASKLDIEASSTGDFSKELKKKFLGTEEKGTIEVVDASKYIEEVRSAKETKNNVKKTYDATKAKINYLLAECDNAKKQLAREKTKDNKEENKKDSTKVHVQSKSLSTGATLASAIDRQACVAITTLNRQAKTLVSAAIRVYKKKKDENKATGESASYLDYFDFV